jgi:hypothetical protein
MPTASSGALPVLSGASSKRQTVTPPTPGASIALGPRHARPRRRSPRCLAFPPGGCAYLHRHQGPGIRCLIEGGIRIDTDGRSTSYGPGGAWYESGPAPVFAQAAADRPSRFIRVLILPRTLLGKSSIQYVNEDDKAKPKSQQYRVFVDTPVTCDPAD